jgi:hypothetical protein
VNRSDGSLWAITSFFNPMRSTRRLSNYHRFRAALTVPLATIELGFNDRWELGPDAADRYMRIGDGDILWQKERLLNLLLPTLPPECEHVAWLDCDLLLQDPDWSRRVVDALAKAPLVQPYATVRHLARGDSRDASERVVESVAARICNGAPVADALGRVTDRTGGAPSPGMAWAARRELLERHGFFDACVIGGGDTALACAAYGMPEIATTLHRMNARQSARYLAWAVPFHQDVCGNVGALAGEIQHLWHGDLVNRRASERHVGLAVHDFDPHVDIAMGAQGAWRWASAKPALHAYVREYFQRRSEDG